MLFISAYDMLLIRACMWEISTLKKSRACTFIKQVRVISDAKFWSEYDIYKNKTQGTQYKCDVT